MCQSHTALLSFGYSTSFEESLQVATSPCCRRDLPDVMLRIFPQMPEPLPRRSAECACLVLPQRSSTFPMKLLGRLSRSFPRTRFSTEGSRGCSYFVMFKPPSLLASQIVPTAAGLPSGQPRRLRPSRTCVVTFTRIGYAIHLTTGNWWSEDSHLARFAALSAAPTSSPYFPVLLSARTPALVTRPSRSESGTC